MVMDTIPNESQDGQKWGLIYHNDMKEMSFSIPNKAVKNSEMSNSYNDKNRFQINSGTKNSSMLPNRENMNFKNRNLRNHNVSSSYYQSGVRCSSKQTTGVKKLMGDSQELTIENFNSDFTKSHCDSMWTNKIADLKNKPITIVKDISAPSGSSKCSYYDANISESLVKFKDVTPRNFEPQLEIIHTPIRSNERISKITYENPLNNWIPTQFVGSPDSISTSGEPSLDYNRNLDQRSIYLYDLKDNKPNLIGESLWDFNDFDDEALNISNDSLNIPWDNNLLKKNLSSIYELTEESRTKSHEHNKMIVNNNFNSFHTSNDKSNINLTFDHDSRRMNKENQSKLANIQQKSFAIKTTYLDDNCPK